MIQETRLRKKLYALSGLILMSVGNACGLADAILVEGFAPSVIVDAQPDRYSNQDEAQFDIHCSKSDCRLKCSFKKVGEHAAKSSPVFIDCPIDFHYKNLVDGNYRFRIQATDTADRRSPIRKIDWTIDTVVPVLNLLKIPRGFIGRENAEFEIECIDESPCVLNCELDGASLQSCRSRFFLSLDEGAHELVVEGRDAAKNVSTSTTISWTVDQVAPSITELDPDFGRLDHELGAVPDPFDDFTNSSTVTFRSKCSESNCRYECQLDDGEVQACNSKHKIVIRQSGETGGGLAPYSYAHTFFVRAIDAGGNVSDWAHHTWLIDQRAPNIKITDGPEENTFSQTAEFSFSCDESDCSFQCNLDGRGPSETWIWKDCTWPLEIPGTQSGAEGPIQWLPGQTRIEVGPHVFRVRGVDRIGNASIEYAEHRWTLLGEWRQVSTSGLHVCAIDTNNTLWCWGDGRSAQIGDGGHRLVPSPVQIGLPGIWQSVNVRTYSSCGLKLDGSYACWGVNRRSGSNGYSSTGQYWEADAFIPTPKSGRGTDWQQLSIGVYHGCGIKNDGSLYTWGNNDNGRLGILSSILGADQPQRPIPSPANAKWKQVDCGLHSCALQTNGRLSCWGNNQFGQLGINSNSYYHYGMETVAVPSTATSTVWARFSVGYDHVCAIDKAANLWCWGNGGSGRLGFAAGSSNQVPRLVASMHDRWLEIAAGQQHTCGIKADGSLWCWGQNKEGQLGTGDFDDSSIPIRVGHDQDWATVSLGLESDHLSCASKHDGQIFCWGSNLYGQLGDGRGDQSIPTKIGDGYSSVAVGEAHSCALKTDQTLWCWGLDLYGQLGVDLGDGEHAAYIASSTPTQVLGSAGSTTFSRWHSISLGGFHSAGIRENGGLYTWGLNGHGQLGLSDSNLPANRDSPSEVRITAVAVNWQQISAGKRHSCGVDANNRLWCWGDCEDGRAGNGRSSGITTIPSRVGAASIDWASVSAGGNSSCATKTNGTLACWGSNAFGQLGIGSSSSSPNPTPIGLPGMNSWSSVSVAEQYACGIQNGGEALCWGLNNRGQLGTQGLQNETMPAAIDSVNNDWTQLDGALSYIDDSTSSNSCGLRGNPGQQSLWCWGGNDFGELGLGRTDPFIVPSPVQIQDVKIGEIILRSGNQWQQIAVGKTHACGVWGNGSLWCWGGNQHGKLGHSDHYGILRSLKPFEIYRP